MSFPSDGTNHRVGIANEHKMTALLGTAFATKLFPILEGKKFTSVHRGGTKSKEDTILLVETTPPTEILVSEKHKKKENTGTFDWSNSTTFITSEKNKNSSSVDALIKVLAEAKQVRNSGTVTTHTVNNFRNKINKSIEDTLNGLQSNDIKTMIKSMMILPNKGVQVVITTKDTAKCYCFSFDVHSMNKYIDDVTARFSLYKKSKKTNCNSRTIIVNTVNSETGLPVTLDTGVRIRLHLNNGVSALLGVSTTNSTSAFCIKFQQDNFQEIKKIATTHQL